MSTTADDVPEPSEDDTAQADDGLLRGEARSAAITGMRELLDLLEAEPEIPISFNSFWLNFYPEHRGAADTADAVAWLGQIAAALDAPITDHVDREPTEETRNYQARRKFGDHVVYEAIHITTPTPEARTS